MLSRTADQLFWMARYTERAENTARMLDANHQLSLLPQSDDYAAACWRSMLSISELSAGYQARFGEVTSHGVIAFMARDAGNASSIANCLREARENARAARPQITVDLWETLNTTWLDAQRLLAEGALERDPGEFFEWVKLRSHLARGVMVDTLLQDEALHFLRLGTYIERADNTARILDVRCAVPLSPGGMAGPAFDFYHWSAVLRAVSGQEAYHKLYRDVMTPARVAELLILNRRWPRSLAANVEAVIRVLDEMGGPRGAQTLHIAQALHASLGEGNIGMILAGGMHDYLTVFLARVNDLAGRVSGDFLVPIAESPPPAAAPDAPTPGFPARLG